MTYVVEEAITEGIYIYLANGLSTDAKPYVGKTKRSFEDRLKEHLDKTGWKNNSRKKLKHMNDVLERFHFGIGEDLLDAMEQFLLDSIGGVDNTANKRNPMGGRPDKYNEHMQLIKKILCKGKK